MTQQSPQETARDAAELQVRQVVRGARRGDQYVRITHHPSFRRVQAGVITTQPHLHEARGILPRLGRFLFGNPIPSAEELTERIGIVRGLAIFSTDNISSSAYATEEIMRVLAFAGVMALSLTMPITISIIVVLAIVVISDLIVIRTYPSGGGSYIVASENLGRLPGLVAAAALLTDYILTVAVSTSAGITALTSAFPALYDQRVLLALAVVAFVTVINLRGVREAGQVFAIPAFVYVGSILALLVIGLASMASGTLPTTPRPDFAEAYEPHPLTLLLLLRAFASGSVALTGVEAVSNGVPSFKPPEVRKAQITLVIMTALFGTIFFGLSFLAGAVGIVPDPHEVETVVSQLARALVGDSWFYYLLQFSTAILLLLAANTAFNGFPRLASILAKDRFLPRQLSFRGDRLAFTGGIVVLAVAAAALIWVYQASVTGLIPLYTVGVFLAFSLSQAGLVHRWWTRRAQQEGWQLRLGVNSVGTFATGGVTLVVAVSKFLLGAWMVLLLIPAMVWMMNGIRRHYRKMDEASQPETPTEAQDVHIRAVIPVARIDVTARQAAAYAAAIASPERTVAVHVTDDEEAADRFRHEWQSTVPNVPLVVIESSYRSLISPFLAYVDAMRETHPDDTLTIILPEYVSNHWWEALLHNQTALRLKGALLFRPGVVVTSIPYHMRG